MDIPTFVGPCRAQASKGVLQIGLARSVGVAGPRLVVAEYW